MNILHRIATTIMFIALASNIFAAESTVPLNSGVSTRAIEDIKQIGGVFKGNSLNPKTQAFNSDSTLLLLRSHLYSMNEPKVKGKHLGSSKNCKWSHKKNQNSIYCVESKNEFYKYSLDNNDNEFLIKIDKMSQMNIGNGEGNLALNDKYIVFSGGYTNSNSIKLSIYGTDENEQQELDPSGSTLENIPAPFIEKTTAEDGKIISPRSGWVSVSPSGNYIVVNQRVLLGADKNNNKLYDKAHPENQDINYHMMRVFSNPFKDGDFVEYGNIPVSGHGDLVLGDKGEYLIQFESGQNSGVYRYNINNINGLDNKKFLFSSHGGGHITCQNYLTANNKCFVMFKNYHGYSKVYSFDPDTNSKINIENSQALLSIPVNSSCPNHKEGFRASPSPDGNKLIFQTSYDLNENGEKSTCLQEEGYNIYVKTL